MSRQKGLKLAMAVLGVWGAAILNAEDSKEYRDMIKQQQPAPIPANQTKGRPIELEGGGKESKKDPAKMRSETVRMHIANLGDKDPEIRQTSAQILGQMGATEAIPNLIEALQDKHVYVQIYAHGALNKLTGKNFGYKNYAEWSRWWAAAKDEYEKKKTAPGVSDVNRLRAQSSNTQGLVYLDAQDFSGAYRMFLDAVNQDPEVPDYRNNLGLSVMEMAKKNPYRYIDAISYFEEALGLDEGLPQPYMNIGQCYSRLGKHIEAQAWYRKAIDRDKNGILWEHCWQLGKELLKKADYQLAMEYLEDARNKAEANRQFDARIYRDLSLVYYALDMHHSAYREILNVQKLGYDLNPDFVAKVRKALEDKGIDPDKEDELARKELKEKYSAESPSSLQPQPLPDQ
jgi:tetratricopeptide (TPR) repeat protein